MSCKVLVKSSYISRENQMILLGVELRENISV